MGSIRRVLEGRFIVSSWERSCSLCVMTRVSLWSGWKCAFSGIQFGSGMFVFMFLLVGRWCSIDFFFRVRVQVPSVLRFWVVSKFRCIGVLVVMFWRCILGCLSSIVTGKQIGRAHV